MQPHNTAMGQVRTTVPFLMIHVGLSIPQIGQMLNLLKKARGFGLFLFYLFFYLFIYLFFYLFIILFFMFLCFYVFRSNHRTNKRNWLKRKVYQPNQPLVPIKRPKSFGFGPFCH
jgi:predicted membrane protein